MYYYAVSFIGYWPVGAVAVVKANSLESARAIFWQYLPLDLATKNTDSTIHIDRIFEDFTMLLDGEY